MALKLLATLTLALLVLVNEGVSHSSIIMPSRTKVTPTERPVFISLDGKFIRPYWSNINEMSSSVLPRRATSGNCCSKSIVHRRRQQLPPPVQRSQSP